MTVTDTTTGTTTRPLALVTGASSGIGLELAKQFAERGYDLVVAAENPDLDAAAAQLRAQGAQVSTAVVDLRTYDGVEQLVDEVHRGGRPLDAVAINAGIGAGGAFAGTGADSDVPDKVTDLDAELDIISLNVTSAVHLAKRVVPEMVQRGKGRVLFTSSIAGTMPGPFEAVYAASKAFVLSFSQALRNELKDSGVSVTALLPGVTDTEFFERGDMLDTRAGTGKKDDPAEVAEQAVDALLKGKDQVVAGSFANKAMVTGGKVMSDPMKAAQHRKLSEPGSGD